MRSFSAPQPRLPGSAAVAPANEAGSELRGAALSTLVRSHNVNRLGAEDGNRNNGSFLGYKDISCFLKASFQVMEIALNLE